MEKRRSKRKGNSHGKDTRTLKGNSQEKGPRTFQENNQGEDPSTSFILRPLQGKVVRRIDCETHLAG